MTRRRLLLPILFSLVLSALPSNPLNASESTPDVTHVMPKCQKHEEGICAVGDKRFFAKDIPRSVYGSAVLSGLTGLPFAAIPLLLLTTNFGAGETLRAQIFMGGFFGFLGGMGLLKFRADLRVILQRNKPLFMISEKGLQFHGYKGISWSRVKNIGRHFFSVRTETKQYGVVTSSYINSFSPVMLTIQGKVEYTGNPLALFTSPPLDTYLMNKYLNQEHRVMIEEGCGLSCDPETDTTTIGMPQMWLKAPLHRVEELLKTYRDKNSA